MAKDAAAPAAKTTTAPAPASAGLKDGDVIRFDYTLWVDGKLLETSEESVAKANSIHREGRGYKPITITLGASQIIKGLESHIRSHGKVGVPVKTEIKAEDAYGVRDPKKVQTIPMAKFKSQKVEPQVGMQLNLGNERGIVTQVGGGRVRVDTNHDLAGKDLTYEYTIRAILSDDKEKLTAVLDNLFPKDSYKVDIGADAVTIEVPAQVTFDQNWAMAKFRVVADVRRATGKGKAIKFVETFPVMPDEPGHEFHNHPPGEGHDE
jgi:FKBP-type peptidyl-prolyl cis-trans isomerase SlyD